MAAVLATGLVATSCSQSGSTDVQSIADPTTTTGLTTTPSSDETPATSESPPALEVEAAGDGAEQPAATEATGTEPEEATTTTAAPAADTTEATTATTVATTATTVATTAAPPPETTAAPTGAETRPELLRLGLPTFGGGTFDTNSMAGKNVVLWFWGAH